MRGGGDSWSGWKDRDGLFAYIGMVSGLHGLTAWGTKALKGY